MNKCIPVHLREENRLSFNIKQPFSISKENNILLQINKIEGKIQSIYQSFFCIQCLPLLFHILPLVLLHFIRPSKFDIYIFLKILSTKSKENPDDDYWMAKYVYTSYQKTLSPLNPYYFYLSGSFCFLYAPLTHPTSVSQVIIIIVVVLKSSKTNKKKEMERKKIEINFLSHHMMVEEKQQKHNIFEF